MLRVALIVIFFGTMIGAMMPSGRHSASGSSGSSRSDGVQLVDGGRSLTAVDTGTGAIRLERNWDGHFYADARVNGMPVKFLVDTGATGIALAHDDAQRAAVPMSSSPGEVIGSGASGEVRGQFVTLDRVELGPKEATRVAAVVLDGGDQSLLGQSFLAQFGSVSIERDTMTLR